MAEFKEAARPVFMIIGYLVILLSLLPIIKSDKWYIRIFDYPRSQKFWINLTLLFLFVLVAMPADTASVVFISASLLNQVYLFLLIRPYTRLAGIQMKKCATAPGERIKLFVANVFQDNRNTRKFFSMVETEDPDLILLVETDEWWANAIRDLARNYPHVISIPQSNTYGMILYSKIRIATHEVRYLADEEIPSIKADLVTEKGFRFRLYALHPKPPVPQESEQSTERDAEILIVAKEAKKCELPVIVAGDLNDVAWSYTTSLFLKVSELLDPRIGRGFYSTFHARYPLMRWPLDHIFCSSHFYLIDLRRMPDIGSDHFPMLLEVAMVPFEVSENASNEIHANDSDIEHANEKIQAGAGANDKPLNR